MYYFVEVPYSYLPGLWTIWHELKENGDLSNHSTPEPSLNKSERDNIRQSLGDLYAAPQNGRIPLAFHTSELRMKIRQRIADDGIDRRLNTYLDNTQFLLKRLSHFVIVDLTARGGTQNAVYEGYRDARPLQPEGPSSHIEGQKCWTMVQPALQRESNGFLARPSFVGCRRHGPLYGEGRWCRVIRLGGLATAVASMIQGQITNANAKKVWSHLFDSNRTFESGELAKVMDKHLFCRPSARDLRGSNNESFKGFHLSWYQLCERPADGTTTRSTWKRGRLYGSQDCFVEQKAFTLGYFASKHYNYEPETIAESFWTLLILGTPFKGTEYPGLHPVEDREYRAEDIMLALIRYGLQEAADAWDSVRTALGSIIDPEPQFLDPTEHDNLLFDDDTFSRSREYFWVVTCLESFQAHVDDATEEWRNFHEGWPKMMMSIDPDRYLGSQKPPEELTSRVRNEIETQVDRLRDISARFKSSRENTMALREGLFSASGVIESRVSTRLGENVKLLTYVSIFYLPLSFCVALWSTNESYTRSMLVLTSVLVAAATFIVVANLRNMTSIRSAAYRGVRRRIVRRMHDDVHDEWVNRAMAFESYRPERLEVEPSEWYILYFVVYSIYSQGISWIKRQPHNLKNLFRPSTSETSSVGSGTTTSNSPVGSGTERSSISSTDPNTV